MNADFSGSAWRKSTRSNSNQECVEVAHVPNTIGIRDSKHPEHPHLEFTPHELRTFLDRLKAGTLDL